MAEVSLAEEMSPPGLRAAQAALLAAYLAHKAGRLDMALRAFERFEVHLPATWAEIELVEMLTEIADGDHALAGRARERADTMRQLLAP